MNGLTSSAPVDEDAGNTRRNEELAVTARETLAVLPDILKQLPSLKAAHSEALFLSSLAPLEAAKCPRRTLAVIRVVNSDTLNAAIDLATSLPPSAGRVAVLNMASHVSPGGGWLKGARAQEEAICYRSSLPLSLHRRHYPLRQRKGLYTRDVVVVRGDMATGHRLLVPHVAPQDLPVVSAISVAALRNPETRRARDAPSERLVYADAAARVLTKDKMRLCLRTAARRRHGLLVLGALGCGAFRNPVDEVAACWLEVFREAEFQGGWWDAVWFAVYDSRGEGNFDVFERLLGGVQV